jgi:hypothetical protein
MAKLYVTEYPDLPGDYARWAPQVVREPPINDQVPVAIGASATQSAVFNPQTRIVRLHTDAICSIAIGPPASTTATANNQRMAANQTEYKMVVNNAGHCVSVITNT